MEKIFIEYILPFFINHGISLIALVLSVITLVKSTYNLRNAQRTTVYTIQIKKVQEIINHLDLLIKEIYEIRLKALSLGNTKVIKSTVENMDYYHSLRSEYIGLIRKNSIILQKGVVDKFIDFHNYVYEEYNPKESPMIDADITHFRMEGKEMELSDKYNELISSLRKEFYVDGLSDEWFKLLSKSKS